jgi:hypothetical protein
MDLLGDNPICFDHKSYDYQEDIPFVTIGGDKYLVDSARLYNEGMTLEVISKGERITLDLSCLSELYTDDFLLNECNLYSLFMDMYYETPKSWEIGDFEIHFMEY